MVHLWQFKKKLGLFPPKKGKLKIRLSSSWVFANGSTKFRGGVEMTQVAGWWR